MPENPMANINISIKNNIEANTMFDSINSTFEKYSDRLEESVQSGLEEMAELVAEHQRDSILSGGHYVTGQLYNSITANVEGLSATIGSTLDGYSPSVIEYGRGPIEADPGTCLHFVSDGKEYFVKSVGPYEGDPYVAPSIEYAKQTIKEIIIKNILGD